jgi:hypothetical protein
MARSHSTCGHRHDSKPGGMWNSIGLGYTAETRSTSATATAAYTSQHGRYRADP